MASNQPGTVVPLITVNLGAPSSTIAIAGNRAEAIGQDLDRTISSEACRVRVRSGGDDIVNVDSKFTVVRHPNGVVQEVMITFPLTAVDYDHAISSMRAVLQAVPDVDAASIGALLDRWEREASPMSVFENRSGRIVSNRGIRLFCEIQFSQKDGLCFCSIEIGR